MIDCHYLLLLLVDDDTIFVGRTYIDLDAPSEALGCESTRLVEIDEDESLPLQLGDLAVEGIGLTNLLVLLILVVLVVSHGTYVLID